MFRREEDSRASSLQHVLLRFPHAAERAVARPKVLHMPNACRCASYACLNVKVPSRAPHLMLPAAGAPFGLT